MGQVGGGAWWLAVHSGTRRAPLRVRWWLPPLAALVAAPGRPRSRGSAIPPPHPLPPPACHPAAAGREAAVRGSHPVHGPEGKPHGAVGDPTEHAGGLPCGEAGPHRPAGQRKGTDTRACCFVRVHVWRACGAPVMRVSRMARVCAVLLVRTAVCVTPCVSTPFPPTHLHLGVVVQAALHQRMDNERERRRAAEEALTAATAPRGGDYDANNDDDDDDDGGFEVLEAGGASGAVMRRRGYDAHAGVGVCVWGQRARDPHVCLRALAAGPPATATGATCAPVSVPGVTAPPPPHTHTSVH
jgi:hypothetical protein